MQSHHDQDHLAIILRSLKVESGLISRGRFQAPWAVRAGASSHAIFHAVLDGSCVVRREGDASGVVLQAGELALLVRGDAHITSDGSDARPVPVGRLPRTMEGGLASVSWGGNGQEASVLCGRFDLDRSTAQMLGELLPPVIVVRNTPSRVVEWLSTTIDLMAWELDHRRAGSDAILDRLTDILFIQIVRAHALTRTTGQVGWLGALRDAHLSRALVAIHTQPRVRWTVASLAKEAGLSRSGFATRFQESVGQTPAAYLTTWRLRQATELLKDAELSCAAVAEHVGYGSEDSLSRAFRKIHGQTPAAWRRSRASE